MFKPFTAATVAALCILSACGPKHHAGLTPEAKTKLATSTLAPVTEPEAEMGHAVVAARTGAVSGGGLLGALIVVAAVSAVNVANAATSDVKEMPSVDFDPATIAQETVIAGLAEATGAQIAAQAVALHDESRLFEPNEKGEAAFSSAAKASGGSDILVNVRTEKHTLRSTGGLGNEDFSYFVHLSAAVVDPADGAILAKTQCARNAPLANRTQFTLASARHAGIDTTEAEEIVRARQDVSQTNDVHSGQRGTTVPDDPTPGMTTPEQDAAFLKHKAVEVTNQCAEQIVKVLLEGVD